MATDPPSDQPDPTEPHPTEPDPTASHPTGPQPTEPTDPPAAQPPPTEPAATPPATPPATAPATPPATAPAAVPQLRPATAPPPAAQAGPTADPAGGPATDPATQPPAPAGRPVWHTGRFWAIAVAGFLVVLLLLAAGIAVLSTGNSEEPAGEYRAGDPDEHIVAGDRDAREAATLHLLSGSTSIVVRADASLGDRLYQVSTPTDADQVPRITDRDDVVEVELDQLDREGPSSVEIRLHPDVRWSVRLSGGADDILVDLTGAEVAEVEFAAGANRVAVTLPEPTGTVPVRLADGASQFRVVAPVGTPVRVQLSAGGGRADIDGESHEGIAPGTEYTTDGWEQATDRYDVDSAGVGEFVLDRP